MLDAGPARRRSDLRARRGPYGILLSHRATGANLLIEEVQSPPESWARAPRHVSIALTNACDLQCSYCYAPKHKAALEVTRLPAWFREMDANGALGVGFGGGEPLVYRGLPHLCRYLETETSLSVSITTHGHHATDELLNQLEGSVHFMRVSVDGVGPIYEKLRGRAFRNMDEAVRRIGARFRFGINCVVNQTTLPGLDDIAEYAERRGARELLLLPQITKDTRTPQADDLPCRLRRWIKSKTSGVPLLISDVGTDGIPYTDPLASEAGPLAYAHIDADGVVKQTSFENFGITIGPSGFMAALGELANKSRESLR